MKTELRGNQAKAVQLMKSTKEGVTVEFIARRLGLENTKAARGLVDRLRDKGIKVKHVGWHKYKIRTRTMREG